MTLSSWRAAAWLTLMHAVAATAQAQTAPQIGYVYPAGGQQGASLQVVVGGQFLDGVNQIVVSGQGVRASVVKHFKPLTMKQINELRQKLQEARQRLQAAQKKQGNSSSPGMSAAYAKIAKELGLDVADVAAFNELRKKLADPKRQPNPQIAETITLQLELAPNAPCGQRELRLVAPSGLSNPLAFHVGQLPEYSENEPNDTAADSGIREPLPLTVNGQIMPGDVDRFRFEARKGQRLVAAVGRKALTPYLADAVPGWFQAALTLYDASGKERAFVDDYRFHPDPVLFYDIPEDGAYTLEIRDAIYRGREDFVYRITLGELPFVTGVFPLGGRAGAQPAVGLQGWNLPADKMTLSGLDLSPGVHSVSIFEDSPLVNRALFALDLLPECFEVEPNDQAASAQLLRPPIIVNGRIDRPGDWDAFYFHCRAGGQVVLEVKARRLNSPLDSLLKLTDNSGRPLAVNDDHEDKKAGLTTHHADSQLRVTIPADGYYYLYLGDAQQQGGPDCSYRLHIDAQRPDFELRVVPSSINVRAGASAAITVHVLREDGFTGDIALGLRDAPPGFRLAGGWAPAGQDQMRLTLSAPPTPTEQPVRLTLEGRAAVAGREIRRQAIPADDMMQAFIYRHLVPAQDWMVAVTEGPRFRSLGAPRGRGRAQAAPPPFEDRLTTLPAGGTARVPLWLPQGPLLNDVQFQLSDPPEGISVQKTSSVSGNVVLLLNADAQLVKPGLKGNLIVEALLERSPAGANNQKPAAARRTLLGVLPAIRFEVVAP